MPIDRLKLAEIDRRVQAELPQTTKSEILRRNLFTPLGRGLSGAVHALFAHQDDIAKQIFPHSCNEDVLLEVHVPIWLKDGRKPPVAATGKVRMSGTVGTPIPQGTLLNRSDGMVYVLIDGSIVKDTEYVDVNVICSTPSASSNTEADAKLRVANPISGIAGEVIVLSPGLSGGADIESIDDLRARCIASRRNGKDVGRGVDYVAWAKEVPGVTRVWVAPKLMGLGTMTVFFVRDLDEDIFPDENECKAVQEHLDNTGTPIGENFAIGPKPRKQDFDIRLKPDSLTTRENVKTALEKLLKERASPVKIDPKTNKTAIPITGIEIPRSHITETISGATGEYDHELLLPTGAIKCEVGELIELGAIKWE